jgi:hypothetical protein
MRRTHSVVRFILAASAVLAAFALAPQPGPRHHLAIPAFNPALEGREDDPGARLEYEVARLHDPATGTIPDNIREKELAFAAGIPRRSESLSKSDGSAAALTTTWSKRGPHNVGGRTRALAFDVTNVNLMLAGGVSGGTWRSTNGGTSWSQATTPSQLHSVTCLVQDPRSGHTSTWYYGTG